MEVEMNVLPKTRTVAVEEGVDDRQSDKSSSSKTPSTHSHRQPQNDDVEAGTVETVSNGENQQKNLGWRKATVCLLVEAIALGLFGMASAFQRLGMVAGVIVTLGVGILATYTGLVIGQVYMRYPGVSNYADAVAIIWGKHGKRVGSVMFVGFLVSITGSHALAGTVAFNTIIGGDVPCGGLTWSIVAAFLLFICALPTKFTKFAWLGVFDFASVIGATVYVIVAAAKSAHEQPGAVDWSMWPPEDITFVSAFLACTNVIFAYSVAVCQFTVMAEMRQPKDHVKMVPALGIVQMIVYTLGGSLIYYYTGSDVAAIALQSSSSFVAKVAFGIALPVIFISGSINSTVVAKYIMLQLFEHDRNIVEIRSGKAKVIWTSLNAVITLAAWVEAEAIPFFNGLLGIISSLFISGFTFYFPSIFWFKLIKEGKWKDNIFMSIINALIFLMGIVVLVVGTYVSIQDIREEYNTGYVRMPFSCKASTDLLTT